MTGESAAAVVSVPDDREPEPKKLHPVAEADRVKKVSDTGPHIVTSVVQFVGDATPNLNAALVAAVQATPWVEWTKPEAPKSGGYGINYEYLSEEDIVKSLRTVLPKFGLSIVPRKMTVVQKEVYNNQKGGRMVNLLISVCYRISHTSGEYIEGEALGEGSDVGDKAANKAMTAAFKYFLRESFLIAGGNDPDRVSSEESARAQKNKNQNQTGKPAAQTAADQRAAPKKSPEKSLEQRAADAMAGIAKATRHEDIKATAKKAGEVFAANETILKKVYNACANRATVLSVAEVARAEDLETVEAVVRRAETDKVGTENLAKIKAAAEKRAEAIAGQSSTGDAAADGEDSPVPLDF